MSKCTKWLPVLENFQRKNLIKSVLGSLGTYFFSTFKAPLNSIKQLESLRRKFFWGESMEDKNISWIAWNKVLSPLENSGLRIGSLIVSSNQAMLAKDSLLNQRLFGERLSNLFTE